MVSPDLKKKMGWGDEVKLVKLMRYCKKGMWNLLAPPFGGLKALACGERGA